LIARAPDAAASTVNAIEGCGVAQQLLGVARMEQGPSLFEALGCGASGARCRGGRNFPRDAGSCAQGAGRRASEVKSLTSDPKC